MSIARVTEIKASSKKSFEDAIATGISKASQTLDNIRSAWVQDQEVMINDKGEIEEYRVLMKVTFVMR